MRMLRAVLVFLLIAGSCTGSAFAADPDRFFDQGLGDFAAELKSATAAGKSGVLLMFELEGCPYCTKLRQQVLSRDDVQAYFRKHFASFAVDVVGALPIIDFAGQPTTEKAYAGAMKIRGTPTIVFFGASGKELARVSGAKDAAAFMLAGRYIAEGHYKTLSLEQFSAQPTEKNHERPQVR